MYFKITVYCLYNIDYTHISLNSRTLVDLLTKSQNINSFNLNHDNIKKKLKKCVKMKLKNKKYFIYYLINIL